jgi:diguanylate cyclase (GGDEF)-like protein
MFRVDWENKAVRRALFFVVAGLVLWLVALEFDTFDHIDRLVHEYEDWQADEILLAFVITSLLGFVFTSSRLWELRQEIARRNKAERDVDWIANHDALTRLPNRRGLAREIDRIEKAGGAAETHAVYSIDLDGFKKVNDLLGHHAGDEALIEVASRLKAIFPNGKVFRLGGDEFAVIQQMNGSADVDGRAARIIAALTRSYALSGSTAELGASVGIARFPDDSTSFETVIRCADMAMYSAKKEKGSSIAHFEQAMNEAMTRRAELEFALREALKAGSIVPYYQPLIDLQTGKIRGFEALARWRDADGNFVPPSDFIRLAEDTGLIVELADQLLQKACVDARNWPDDIRLAFNISPAQLNDKLLGLRILRILGSVGFPPHRLEVEITESALVRDIELAETILSDLHDSGITIALDDFGTGYSSLSQLSKFKFDKIKIDRSFVASFEGDEKQEKIVRAMLGLGHGLGITTTAEGIETSMQEKTLRALGCDYGQGFLFGKAMASQDVPEFLSDGPVAKVS